MQLYFYKLISGLQQALLVSMHEINLDQATNAVLRTMTNHNIQSSYWFGHLVDELCTYTDATRFNCQNCLDVTEMWQEETAHREECK